MSVTGLTIRSQQAHCGMHMTASAQQLRYEVCISMYSCLFILLPVRFGAALLLLIRLEFLALDPVFVGTLHPAESIQLDHKMAWLL